MLPSVKTAALGILASPLLDRRKRSVRLSSPPRSLIPLSRGLQRFFSLFPLVDSCPVLEDGVSPFSRTSMDILSFHRLSSGPFPPAPTSPVVLTPRAHTRSPYVPGSSHSNVPDGAHSIQGESRIPLGIHFSLSASPGCIPLILLWEGTHPNWFANAPDRYPGQYSIPLKAPNLSCCRDSDPPKWTMYSLRFSLRQKPPRLFSVLFPTLRSPVTHSFSQRPKGRFLFSFLLTI